MDVTSHTNKQGWKSTDNNWVYGALTMSTSRWSAFSATIYMFLILAVFVGRPAGAVIVIDNATGSAISPGWFVNPSSPIGETAVVAGTALACRG